MERLHSFGTLEKVRHNPVQKEQETYQYKIMSSPVGSITLIASERALVSLMWGEVLPTHFEKWQLHESRKCHPVIELTEIQLMEYFSGQRISFEVPLAPKGTEFQRRAWEQLLKIPYGQYITYGEQARRLGQPNAARAVGAANGKNPIGIIIPCHRVIGASGSLIGFTGGLEIKRQLLAIEGIGIQT